MNQPTDLAAGSIVNLQFLGVEPPEKPDQLPLAAFYFVYRSTVDDGVNLAAKLHLPVGDPPDGGWPISVWCHGLGDPASDFKQWPYDDRDWRRSRGHFPGRWARQGVATLTPWLPGTGPSEPLATYSPLSLERNFQGVIDCLSSIQNVESALEDMDAQSQVNGLHAALNRDQLIVRTDCVSTPLMVYFASRWKEFPQASGLKALVADDFQPSVAYTLSFLEQFVNQLPAQTAAAMRCIWTRSTFAMARYENKPLTDFYTPAAAFQLSKNISSPVGLQPQILVSQLVPPKRSKLGAMLFDQAMQQFGREPTSAELADWLYTPELLQMLRCRTPQEMVSDPFYRKHYAASDPFFEENIAPFSPDVPLLVIARAGAAGVNISALPGFRERFEHMTKPKVETLRSWGWDVQLLAKDEDQGTSFSEGPAQKWTLDRLADILS